jgi:hypothetical protein
MSTLRTDLPPLPDRIKALPVCPQRLVPVPWFVVWIDGRPEFRVADADKRRLAVLNGLCWVCGQSLGRYQTFVLGPMCAVNRVSAEPPCHLDCAEFSVKACPFLSKPRMVRRENDLPENTSCDGEMIRRNPGATALWTTRSFRVVSDGKGGTLFQVGDPVSVSWWACGRQATAEEVAASVESGLPLLRQMAQAQGEDAVRQLEQMFQAARRHFPRVPASCAQ